MPIELKIIANNAFELAGELRQLGYVPDKDVEALAQDLAEKLIVPVEETRVSQTEAEYSAAEHSEAAQENAAVEQPKKRRGRPPKVKVEEARAEIHEKLGADFKKLAEQPREVIPQEADDTPVPFAERVPDEDVPPPTPADMAKSALVQLNSVGGRDAALEVLGRFGAKKFSEVPPERHDEFREICIIETQKRAS